MLPPSRFRAPGDNRRLRPRPPRRCSRSRANASDRVGCGPARRSRCPPEHRRLGEHDRTGRAHPRHDRGVGLGHPIATLLVPAGTRQTGDVDPVLDGDRQAVQRTDRTVTIRCAIEHVGARQRVFIVPRRHTVGDLVQRAQPRERRLDGLARGLRIGHRAIMPRCRAPRVRFPGNGRLLGFSPGVLRAVASRGSLLPLRCRERVERGAGGGFEGVLPSRGQRGLAHGGREGRDAVIDVAVACPDLPWFVARAAPVPQLLGGPQQFGRRLGAGRPDRRSPPPTPGRAREHPRLPKRAKISTASATNAAASASSSLS